MQIHELSSTHLNRPRKRVGRGGKRGTYSGHGGKGQTARSGRKFRPIVREVLKRYPKLRGYKNHAVGVKPQTVDVAKIQARFEAGQTVNPASLVKKDLVPRESGKLPVVKILGTGEVTRALIIEKCLVSKSAKEKIEKAGGTVKN
jgi:large subunit ribosomal protein L15